MPARGGRIGRGLPPRALGNVVLRAAAAGAWKCRSAGCRRGRLEISSCGLPPPVAQKSRRAKYGAKEGLLRLEHPFGYPSER